MLKTTGVARVVAVAACTIMLAVGCEGSDDSTATLVTVPIDSTTTQASPAGASSIPQVATTTTASEPTLRQSSRLVATPEEGQPGDRLSICGSLGKADEIIVIYLVGSNGDIWPDSTDSEVTTEADGTFCWLGEYPAELQVTETGDQFGTRHPIAPGTYELVAGYGSFDFAQGEVRVLEYER